MNNNINKKVHMRIMFSSRSLLLLHLITSWLTEYENCRKIQKNALTIPITVGIFFFFSQTQKKYMKMDSFIEIMKCEWKRWRRYWLCVFVWISTSNEIIVITLIKINYWNALYVHKLRFRFWYEYTVHKHRKFRKWLGDCVIL